MTPLRSGAQRYQRVVDDHQRNHEAEDAAGQCIPGIEFDQLDNHVMPRFSMPEKSPAESAGLSLEPIFYLNRFGDLASHTTKIGGATKIEE